jgi:hypothetical protein
MVKPPALVIGAVNLITLAQGKGSTMRSLQSRSFEPSTCKAKRQSCTENNFQVQKNFLDDASMERRNSEGPVPKRSDNLSRYHSINV